MARRLSDYERELREKERYEKELAKERKERARKKGYKISTLEDTNRINGYLKDYVFYQFFALKYELNDLTEEQLKEITPKKRKFQAEWRVNNLPKIKEKEETQNVVPKENTKNFIFFFGVFISLLIICSIISFFNVSSSEEQPQNTKVYKQKDVVIPVKKPVIEEQPKTEETQSFNTQQEEKPLYQRQQRYNVLPNYQYYKSPADIKAEEKARKKQEKQAEKAEKKWKKAEKKAAKKLLKQEKKLEKQNKKKDKSK